VTSVILPATRRAAGRRLSSRGALLLGTALLPMAMASTAQAQTGETVVLGGAPQEVHLGAGDDRVVVDIARLNADTGALDLSGLVTGDVTDDGGLDKIWVRASANTAHDVAFTNTRQSTSAEQFVTAGSVPFDGGTVYEASGNDTVLTLENRSRSTATGSDGKPTNNLMDLNFGPLRLAGDGKVVISFSLAAANQLDPTQKAIFVEQGSTLADQGAGDGMLDVEVQGSVGGDYALSGLIDVSNAKSLTLSRNASGASQVQFRQGVGIVGGEATINIERNVWMNTTHDEGESTLIRSSGRVNNSGLLTIGGQYGNAVNGGVGVRLEGGRLYNMFTENANGNDTVSGGIGTIYGGEHAVVSEYDTSSLIENAGVLKASTGTTIQNRGRTLVTRNIIKNFTVSGRRVGEIIGGTVAGEQIAYGSEGGTDVVVNSGKITGNVLLGAGHGMFLYTEATNGVTGTIDGDDGVDGYGKSFSASATHDLNNNILNQGNNSGFEMHGIEASGANTVVTVSATGGPLDAGLMLIGDGTVVNTANITTDGYGVWSRQIDGIAEGMDFINRGAITSRLELGVRGQNLSSFLNESDIRSGERGAALISNENTARGPTFKFTNTGLIESAARRESGAVLLFYNQATEELLADIVNSGTIRHTGDIPHTDNDEQYAFLAETRLLRELGTNYRMRAVNSGTIEATGRGFSGMQMRGSNIELVNESIIRGTNAAGGGVRLAAGNDGIAPRGTAMLTNRGTISGGSGAIGDTEFVRIGYGVLFDFARPANGGEGSLVNEGTIEVGAEGVAVGVDGGQNTHSAFTLVNRGTIRGGDGYTLIDDPYILTAQLLADGKNTIAGAIHTNNSVDSVTNRGTITGSVDLGDLDDTLANYGALNGEVMLAEGNDSYVTGSGAALTGTVDGGADYDVIKVDLTGSDAKRIDAGQFRNFEALGSLDGSSGTGVVSLFGNIDVDYWRLRNIVLNINAGDTVSSATGATEYTFYTAQVEPSEETLNNAGTIVGGVYLGWGNDRVDNKGTISGDVGLGSGEDLLDNAGRIAGTVTLGDGDDVVTNSGIVDGNVRLDEGDDTITNSGRVNGDLLLGNGDDRYVAQSGGVVTGLIDGGAGTDTFVFRLNGNSGSIPGGFTNFESFGAYGPGTLTLALDQDYDTIELFETANLTLTDGSGTVGQIKGDDSAQIVTIEDRDFTGGVSLAGGNDTLSMHLDGALGGALDGGNGTDTLKLQLDDFSSINDLFNFEIVDVTGGSPLRLIGTLGAGQQINFDGSDNRFIVDADAVFAGNANGGEGTDTFEVYTGGATSRTIVSGQLTSFEKLISGGAGTLALNGQAYSFQSVDVAGNLAIGDGASLASASGVNFGDGDNRLTLEGSGVVTSPVDGGDGTDTIAFSLAAGQTRNLSSLGTLSNFEILAASGAGTLSVDQNATYQNVSIEGGHLSIAGGATLTAPVSGGATADRLTVNAGGAVAGSVNLGAGNDTVDNRGTITGDVNLGDGDDRYIARSGGVVTGTIDGGAGDNTFVFNLENATGSLPGSVLNFNSFGVYGPGTLTVNLDAGQTYQNLEILEGANLVLSGTNGSVANVIGDDSAQSVTIDGALTGGVSLGGGDDSLTMHLSGLLDGALDGGAGNDTLNLTLDGASSIHGMFGFETANITGASPLTLTGDFGANQRINFAGNTDNELIVGAGAVFSGTVDGGGGHDLLRVQSGAAQNRTVVASQILSFEDLVSEGAGTLALTGGAYSFESVAVNGGNLELGAGTTLGINDGLVFDGADNRFTLGSGASVIGHVDGGAGNDVLALVQGAGTTRLLSAVDYTGFERLESSGSGNGELRIDRNASFANGVGLDGGIVNVTAGNTLTANVTGGANRDFMVVGGRIEGNLDLGAGDDFLTITGAGAITGTRSGGEGTDTLTFNTSGTAAAPTAFDAGAWTGFEALNVEGGVVSLTGTGSYAAINVAGGRLIGQAGSVISAASPIQVAHGATFGSAGRVNADILVAGTLSPGASPGTMTVNGNVNFQPGSNLLLEVSPTASDLLNISGTLAIANGATMDITGVLHGTPGNRLDLVVAQGGITGRFTTINKSNDIFGFVVQNGNRLQIQSEFLNGAYPTNISASIDYANTVLRAGYGVQAFTAALPVLVDAQGAITQQAFAQLTPEPYGSAIQLGEENSLLIVDGVHGAKATRAEDEGLYTFGQFLAGRADVQATNGLSGASASRVTNRGFFAGLGYGLSGGTQVGAFVGGLDSKQSIEWLGAKTGLDALAGGVFGDTRLGGFGVHGLIGYNGGKAETKRRLFVNNRTGKAKYDLTSWIADLGVDYQVRLGGWTIAPKLGVTYVRTSRGAATEQGLGDFSLTVDKGHRNSWFGEAAVAASGSFDLGGAKLTPYAQIGVRQLMGDARVPVTGEFTGAGSKITVDGIEREGTALRVALGLGVDLSEGVRLQAGYSGEFTGTERNSVMGGLTFRF